VEHLKSINDFQFFDGSGKLLAPQAGFDRFKTAKVVLLAQSDQPVDETILELIADDAVILVPIQ
jgi:hypothetical protein